MLACEDAVWFGGTSHYVGTLRSSSSSQTFALPSDGARQSPRGDRFPPDTTLGPLGSAERLYWLISKKRNRNTPQPFLDVGKRVGVLRLLRKVRRPRAAGGVAPRVPREKRDLRRPQAVARDVVEVEILQLVGPDLFLGALQVAASRPPERAPARSRCRGSRAASPAAAASNCFVFTTQRTRYWISVLRPSRSRCSGSCGRRRRTCTSRARAPTGRRCRARTPCAGWRGGRGNRCAAPPARSRT